MESPELGTALDDLVSRLEDGDITEEEAAREAPISLGKSVGIAIQLSKNVADVVQFLEDNGVTPLLVDRDYIEAFVPVSLLRQISDLEGVLYVETILPPLPPQLPQEIPGDGPRAHRSTAWNDAGFTGKGIKIGVIDSGFEGFSELMGTELPATVHARCYGTEIDEARGLKRCDGSRFGTAASNHGTVVAESIIDIAPEAELYIGVARSLGDLREIVNWMISEGVLVINASQRYRFDGPGDGTSPRRHSPLNTVDHAVENNVVWVNSAGNDARGSWFGTPTDADGDGVLEFGGTEQLRVLGNYSAQLRWEGAWGGQSLDLDLYFYDTDGNVISRSINPQDGGAAHVPYEVLKLSPRGSILQVANRSDRLPGWVQIVAVEAFMEGSAGNGSITNGAESANEGMLAVGASHWQRVDTIEDYSSRGPTPDGRVKPDLVGVACGETTLKRSFCGTSASSPHVAGLAALVRQRFPEFTPQQVVAYLKDNAEQREDGLDPNNTWGHGFAVLPYGVLTDRAALVKLYESTNGANWANSTNWLSERPLGKWHGVTTGADGRVTVVDLRRNNLEGELPVALGYLSKLVLLNLGANLLTGEIPAELGDLGSLIGLHLFDNQLGGEIPAELGNLANLRALSIHSNQLSGRIPARLGDLPSLTGLWLYSNRLRGRIPAALGSLANLTELRLDDNQLSDEIPAELGNLANLTSLHLGRNSLAGPIPPELGSLVSLKGLRLNDNQLSGEIPAELGNLASLTSLHLNRNSLEGPIPSELGNLASLTELWLSDNRLSGVIPAELGNLASLVGLDLGDNQLSGEVPGDLGGLSNLEILRLSGNSSLSGPLPGPFTGLASLRVLWPSRTELCAPTDEVFQRWLRGVENTRGVVDCPSATASADRDALVALYNATDGPNWYDSTNWLSDRPIGEWYGVTTHEDGRVAELLLDSNGLVGRMPAELGRLNYLRYLYLNSNQLSGPIPPELGNLANLRELALNFNQLTGAIPPELGNLASLRLLALGVNELSGSIPAELGNLANLEELLLAVNWLSGPIPAELGRLYNLELLYLNSNQVSGSIPPELGNLANLREMALDDNELSGPVPPELGSLASLQGLWLHVNQLSGPLPDSFTGLGALESLEWHGTELCAATDAAFQAWLSGVAHRFGEDCAAAASPDRDALVALYNATGGPHWNDNANWLSDLPIGEWYGVTTDEDGRVTVLWLPISGLVGRIPPELGSLARLWVLELSHNQLSGRIPAELGSLANLRHLGLYRNQLSGRVPAELGNLANLQELSLSENDLSGPIPPELGNLANLQSLSLHDNRLSGPLPDSFTALDALAILRWGNTELCAPTDTAFQAWLRGVAETDGEDCAAAASPDRAALVALYSATGGPNWDSNANWLSDEPIGEWYGVTTDGSGRVIRLDLNSNGLVGNMTSELGSLTNLRTLDLGNDTSGNRLSGEIPVTLGDLASLEVLNLAGNQLSGGIPEELGNLTELQVLHVPNNRLGGEIPSGLGNLANLEHLELAHNQFSGGIPSGLGRLKNLRFLYLNDNPSISGSLPSSLTALDALATLRWGNTELCAPTDAAFQAWLSGVADRNGENCAAAVVETSDRDVLVALYNATDGPNWFDNTNWLSDRPIGEWYGVTTDDEGRVTTLDLSGGEDHDATQASNGNGLNGQLPPELGNLHRLQYLNLKNNRLSGEITSRIGDLSNLKSLDLSDNGFSGDIPSALGRLSNLESLDLSFTRMSGELPSEIGRLSKLRHLDLSHILLHTGDQLRGDIPAELGELVNLETLDLSYNGFNGEIPAELGNLSNLIRLELFDNDLNGEIPMELDGLSSLQWLELGNNDLSGEIPPQLGSLSSLEVLQLDNNRLSGELPAELGGLTNLTHLHLYDNSYLSGPLPGSFTRMTSLGELLLEDTDLCAPSDGALQQWLRGISSKSGVVSCPEPVSNDFDDDDDGLIEIASLAQLNAVRWDLNGDGTPSFNAADYDDAFPSAASGMGCPASGCTGYELAENLDFDTNGNGQADSGDDYWDGGEGWDPIGSNNDNFSAVFDGGGHTISNLHIDREASYLGLFGSAAKGSEIKNIGLVKANVTGTGDGRGSHIGGLVGLNRGAIDNSYTSGGTISGISIVGGLVGDNFGSVTSSRSSASVTGQRFYTGGLVGRMCGPIASSYATGNVNGNSHVGGLAGGSLLCEPGLSPITASYATGKVTGDSRVGGLVGSSKDPITDSYATGNVAGDTEVGGLVGGTTAPSTTITTSYSTGKVTGNSDAGGLLGYNFTSGTRATSSYWDTETSGQSSSAVGEGKTTSELQSPTSNTGIYSTWDPDVWNFGTSSQYPRLRNVGPR